MTWNWWDIAWPYVGLAGAIAIVALLATRRLIGEPGGNRWRDPRWLAWLGLAAYLVHQFEEYGIDATGRQHAFPSDMCGVLGYPAEACPIPAEFYLAVNHGAIWVAGLIGALVAKRYPALGLSLYGIIFTNAIVHVVGTVAQGEYGAGLVTALVVFIPLCIWVAVTVFVRGPLGVRPMLLIAAGGAIQHAVLLASAGAFVAGRLPGTALIGIQVLNTFPTLAIMAVWERSRSRDKRRVD